MKKLALFFAVCFTISCSKDIDETQEQENKSISKTLNGFVEKGPFVKGTTITINELEKDLSKTGKTFTTQTLNDKGEFNLKNKNYSSNFLQLSVDGFYFHEISGKVSTSKISLFALANIDKKETLNVNVLTHLEKKRVEYLMDKEEKSFSDAKKQASKEILKSFGIDKKDGINTEDFSIASVNENANILIAISSVLLNGKTDKELVAFLSEYSNDLQKDGIINEKSVTDRIKTDIIDLFENDKFKTIAQHIKTKYKLKGDKLPLDQLNAIFKNPFAKVLSFKLNGVNGTIDQSKKEITVILPFTQHDITKLKGEITLSKQATADKNIATEIDYSSDVTFTITAQDGTKNTYTVKVLNNENKILSLKLNGVAGTIDHNKKEIIVALTFSKNDITKLKGEITLSNQATADKDITIERDYTNNVTFTVTGNGNNTTYTVKVLNNEKKILSFKLAGVNGTIDESKKEISVIIPFGNHDITKLTGTLTLSPQATADKNITTQIDYTNDVAFTITAQDGTTKTYTVKLINNSAKVLSLKLAGVAGTIDHSKKEITVALPFSKNDITKLKGTLTLSPQATADKNITTEIDYTSPVPFTITAQDGTKNTYTVKVLNNENKILSLKLNGVAGTIDHSKKEIIVSLPFGNHDITKLTGTLTLSPKATVDKNITTQINYTNDVTFTVTGGGNNSTYTVKVKNTEKKILSFKLAGVDGTIDESKKEISVIFPFGNQDITKLTGTLTLSPQATADKNISTEIDYTNDVTFTITAQNGTTKTYTVKVRNTEKKILSFKLAGVDGTIDESRKEIIVALPFGNHDITKLTGTLTLSPQATADKNITTQIDYTSDVTFTITAQDGTTKTYTVKVKNTEKKVLSFKLAGVDGTIDESKKEITVVLPFGNHDITKLTGTLTLSPQATADKNISTEIDYTSDVTFTITAQNGTTNTYTVKVRNSEKKILSFKLAGVDGTIDHSKKETLLAVPYGNDLTNLNATYTLSDGATVTPKPESVKDYTSPVSFTVTAQDGTTNTYTVSVKIEVTNSNLFDVVYGEIKKLGSNANLNHLDMSKVTNMKDLFNANFFHNTNPNPQLARTFNGDISQWDTSSVTTMEKMFKDTYAFNSPIGDWNTSSVTNMKNLFINADAFNQPLNDWNTSSVTNMNGMFSDTNAFNQPLNDWNTSKVTTMAYMFSAAKAFNQPLNKWNTSSVTDMDNMFNGAIVFNQPLNKWNTSSVTSMYEMFWEADAFNQP